MKSKFKFSVLMSLYAKEQPDYLHQSLSSLVAQTVPADEIIMVLDGAISPPLQTVLNEFSEILPIKILALSDNVGLGRALNAGLAICRHEWVMRMDTDDIALPQRFEWQCAYIEKNPHLDVLGGQIAEFSHTPNDGSMQRRVPCDAKAIYLFAKKRCPFNHMTVAYRKSMVQSVGSYQHHWHMEDYNLWLRLLAHHAQVANLPEILVYARTGASMLHKRRGWSYILSEWQLFCLKRQLHIQSILPALYYLSIRTLVRILPIGLLRQVYQKLH